MLANIGVRVRVRIHGCLQWDILLRICHSFALLTREISTWWTIEINSIFPHILYYSLFITLDNMRRRSIRRIFSLLRACMEIFEDRIQTSCEKFNSKAFGENQATSTPIRFRMPPFLIQRKRIQISPRPH